MNNVAEYLRDTAERFPDKVALSDVNGDITFTELNVNAKKLATLIIDRTKGKINSPIAVKMKKCKECIVAFMGIVYSGNYYCPIDLSMPSERNDIIFDTLNPILVITKDVDTESNSQIDYNIIMQQSYNDDAISNQLDKIISVDPLFVLFTSGSTGMPKGVVVSHASVIDYTEWLTKIFQFNEHTVFGNQAPLYYVNSILDIYSTLRNGSRMYFINQELFAFSKQLMSTLKKNDVNTIFWVPSALIAVADAGILSEDDQLPDLKQILFCGEVMPTKQLMIWKKRYGENTLFANLYGATEIADACSYYIIDKDYSDDEVLPIGKACNNTEIIIINENGCISEVDETGEIYVRGTSIAKGYYRNREKTESAFVQNPLHNDYIDICYKTGDIAKINREGNIEYIGRKDNQIKFQGHRIELGEIEAAAMSADGVGRACAVYADVGKKIVLFAVLAMGGSSVTSEKEIYRHMKTKIPKYMLPSEIIIREELPLNANGKIDRIRLKEQVNGRKYN